MHEACFLRRINEVIMISSLVDRLFIVDGSRLRPHGPGPGPRAAAEGRGSSYIHLVAESIKIETVKVHYLHREACGRIINLERSDSRRIALDC